MRMAPGEAWDATDDEERAYEVAEGGDWEYMRGS